MMPTISSLYRIAALLASKERNRRGAAATCRVVARSFASSSGTPTPTTTTSRDNDRHEPTIAASASPSSARRDRHGMVQSRRPPRVDRKSESLPQGSASASSAPSFGSEAASRHPRRHNNSSKNHHRILSPSHEEVSASRARQHRAHHPSQASDSRDTRRNDGNGAAPNREEMRQSPQGLLRDLAGRLVRMQTGLDRLGPIPPVWEFDLMNGGGRPRGDSQRDAVAALTLAELRHWIKDLRNAVEGHGGAAVVGTRLSLSKHRHELTVLLERSMRVCGDAASPSHREAHDLCNELLDLMTSWGLNWQQRHIDSAIAAAARVGRWDAAAALFESQIDPDRGNRPVDVSVAEPVGLYALARHWQQQHSVAPERSASEAPEPTVVDRVMDAVNRMSMLSSTDQESYILAAGTALGRAGEWHDLIYFLRNNPKAEALGQPLIAAAMHACILRDRHEEALWLYDEHVVARDAVLASDWQWAGGDMARLNPLCRDLAMRAMGGLARSSGNDEHNGIAARALEFYWNAMDDGVTVSLEALCGVAEACRSEGRWEDAMSVLFSVLTKSFHVRWLVPGNNLATAQVDDEISFHPDILPKMGTFVGTVIAACNDTGHFATGVLAASLLQLSLPPHVPMAQDAFTKSLPESLFPVIDLLHESRDDILVAVMEALVALQCSRESLMLYELVVARAGPEGMLESQGLYDSIRQTKNAPPSSIWPSTFAKMHRFMISFRAFIDDETPLLEYQAKHMSFALASLVALCTEESQAQAGLTLTTWVDLHTSLNESLLPMTDSLVGSLIEANAHCGNYDAVMDLMNSVKTDSHPNGRLMSSLAAVKYLFKHSMTSEAVSLFDTVVKYSHSPDLMSAVASGLLRSGEWSAALDLYRLALSKGCLSEEICLLAIKAVSAGRVDGRFRIMRNIIEDASSLAGITPNDWIELKYWDLKRLIGFAETARLMWWGDPQTRNAYELNFAFECLQKRKIDGLTPKNDALRLIASASKSYRSFQVPEGGAGFSYLPRCVSDWKRALNITLDEARHSSLFASRDFIESVAIGFAELGSFEDATRIIDDAVDRGVEIERSVLYSAGPSTAAST